jgi:hypothetical protein
MIELIRDRLLSNEVLAIAVDISSEDNIWQPFRTENLSMTNLSDYPPMPGRYVSCFSNSCKIAIIIKDMILGLYSRRRVVGLDDVREDLMARLSEWREQSPTHLRYDVDKLPEVCPPPHIMCQKYVFPKTIIYPISYIRSVITNIGSFLYHATAILLHRPFSSATIHFQTCMKAARDMETLLLLYEKTFGFENITYLMAYCIYTGATALLQDVKAGSQDASAKIRTFTRALRQGLKKCPLLQRSLDNIEKGMQSTHASQPTVPTFQTLQDPNNHAFISAFPYYDYPGANSNDTNVDFGHANGAISSMLDCFPEVYVGNSDWWPPRG